MTPPSLHPTDTKEISFRYYNLAFILFCLSTAFIILYSVRAINFWPPLVEKSSILIACFLPAGIFYFSRSTAQKTPKEVIWLFLIAILGLTSSLLSENPWASVKAIALFMASGPLIFITTKYLFESEKNREVFYWLTSLMMFILSIFGTYELYNHQGMLLFSRNPLPAGALLILLSTSTIILLKRNTSSALRILLALSLIISSIVIIWSAKKGHFLGITIIIAFFLAFRSRRYFSTLFGFIIFIGCTLYFSFFTLSKNKDIIYSDNSLSSYTLRAENYFFGIHIIKSNPIWGVGFKADFTPYFSNYKITLSKAISKKNYQHYIKTLNTFENIILTYLIERGPLFSLAYFGGILYLVVGSLNKAYSFCSTDMALLLVISVIAGFSFMSLTFDTLRFPNLNWLFHSFLGLMVNLSNTSSLQPR
jgi:hypothetical protein